jgi:hypothetical protein
MNSGPFLILHKVRGEPAFDIAERLSDETWIIPTIGHKAYPWQYWALEDLADISDINEYGHPSYPISFIDELPADHRDHYVAAQPKLAAKRLAEKIHLLTEFNVTPEELAEALAAVRGQSKESKP